MAGSIVIRVSRRTDSTPLTRSVSEQSAGRIRTNNQNNESGETPMANEYEKAARKLREANDDLDSVRRAKRTASEQTPGDVNRHAQKVAERENWSGSR